MSLSQTKTDQNQPRDWSQHRKAQRGPSTLRGNKRCACRLGSASTSQEGAGRAHLSPNNINTQLPIINKPNRLEKPPAGLARWSPTRWPWRGKGHHDSSGAPLPGVRGVSGPESLLPVPSPLSLSRPCRKGPKLRLPKSPPPPLRSALLKFQRQPLPGVRAPRPGQQTPGFGKMRAALQAEGPLYEHGHKTQIPCLFESALRQGPVVKVEDESPSPQPRRGPPLPGSPNFP